MNVMTAAARWITGRAKLANDLPAAESLLAEIEANPPHSADPVDHLAWVEKRDAARREVEALRGALAIATAEAAKAEAAAEAEAKVSERAGLEKEAKATEALVREIARDAEKLADKVAKLEEHRKRAEAAGIPDAEYRVRSKPGRIRPAITETKQAWFDPSGRRFASNYTTDASGRTVEATDRVRREVVDVLQEEGQDPPSLPLRFAAAIKLVDLEGRPL